MSAGRDTLPADPTRDEECPLCEMRELLFCDDGTSHFDERGIALLAYVAGHAAGRRNAGECSDCRETLKTIQRVLATRAPS